MIWSRFNGRRHAGLKELRPTNTLYRALLYRLEGFSLDRTPWSTGQVKYCIKRMALSFRNQVFTGKDRIPVLDFLARFVAEADIVGMNEGQALVSIPYFLRGIAEDQFNSIRGSSLPSNGGDTCWPEAFQ